MIFARAIPGDWGPHLATMRSFWSSVMLTSGRYKETRWPCTGGWKGFEPRLFERWLALFGETCGELFEEEVAAAFRAEPPSSPRASSWRCFTGRTSRSPAADRSTAS